MQKQHWPDRVNILLGLWICVPPWVLAHAMVSGSEPGTVTGSLFLLS